MNIEVTEPEALEIYSQRYLAKRKKSARILFGLLGALTIISWLLLSYYVGSLQGLIALVFLVPIFYASVKRINASKEYARTQVEGQK